MTLEPLPSAWTDFINYSVTQAKAAVSKICILQDPWGIKGDRLSFTESKTVPSAAIYKPHLTQALQ